MRIALLFSTALDLDPVTLYCYYAARFQIEFLFRDSKPFAGLTHCQARRTDALTFQVNASLTAVSLSKLQAVRILGHLPTPFSMASLARRCFNEHFLKKIPTVNFPVIRTTTLTNTRWANQQDQPVG